MHMGHGAEPTARGHLRQEKLAEAADTQTSLQLCQCQISPAPDRSEVDPSHCFHVAFVYRKPPVTTDSQSILEPLRMGTMPSIVHPSLYLDSLA